MATVAFHSAGRNDGRLYRAVTCGDRRTVVEELRKGDIDPDLTIQCKTLLHHAGERGFKDIARLLVEYGADVNRTYGKRSRSLLHFAAATYRYGFASVLLESGANPAPRTSSKATPLHFAARSGQSYLISLLLDCGAEINVQDSLGRTPLYLAELNGHVNLVQRLISSNGKSLMKNRKGIPVRKVAEDLGLDI